MTIAKRLGLDKSLASKVVRAAKAVDPLMVVHEAPAAAGLAMVAQAAHRAGAADAAIARLDASAERLIKAIDGFPGGRDGLDVALTKTVPELREASQKKSRRTMYKAMVNLTGFDVETLYVAYWYMPSESEPDRCDSAWVTWNHGLARYKSQGQMLLGGIMAPESDREPNRYSFADGSVIRDPRKMVLPECTTVDPSNLSVHRYGRVLALALGEDTPPMGERVDVAQGSWSTMVETRYRRPGRNYELLQIARRRPTRTLLADFFLGPGVFGDAEPMIASRLSGIPFEPSELGPQESPFDLAEEPCELRSIDPTRSMRAPEAPGLDELIGSVHRSRGWDPGSMRAWRLRIEYPLPSIDTMVWFKLPEPPA